MRYSKVFIASFLVFGGFFAFFPAEVSAMAASWCHNFNLNLGIGSKGTEVWALKTALLKEGISLSAGLSAEFDQKTALAVAVFQEKYKSEVLTPARLKRGNGYVGKLTRDKLNKLYSCKTVGLPQSPAPVAPAAPAAATSSIRVISPNGGEQLTQNSSYYLQWSVQGIDVIDIILINYVSGERTEIKNSISANAGQYFWTVPSAIVGGAKYKILVKSKGASDLSDNYFSIAAVKKVLAPSIILLSPQGGEKWEKGKTYSVRWLFQDLDKIDSITLRSDSKNETYSLASNIGATFNSFDWTVPLPAKVIEAGDKYRVKLESCVAGVCYSDQSDNYFSVAAAGTSEINLADIFEALRQLVKKFQEIIRR